MDASFNVPSGQTASPGSLGVEEGIVWLVSFSVRGVSFRGSSDVHFMQLVSSRLVLFLTEKKLHSEMTFKVLLRLK